MSQLPRDLVQSILLHLIVQHSDEALDRPETLSSSISPHFVALLQTAPSIASLALNSLPASRCLTVPVPLDRIEDPPSSTFLLTCPLFSLFSISSPWSHPALALSWLARHRPRALDTVIAVSLFLWGPSSRLYAVLGGLCRTSALFQAPHLDPHSYELEASKPLRLTDLLSSDSDSTSTRHAAFHHGLEILIWLLTPTTARWYDDRMENLMADDIFAPREVTRTGLRVRSLALSVPSLATLPPSAAFTGVEELRFLHPSAGRQMWQRDDLSTRVPGPALSFFPSFFASFLSSDGLDSIQSVSIDVSLFGESSKGRLHSTMAYGTDDEDNGGADDGSRAESGGEDEAVGGACRFGIREPSQYLVTLTALPRLASLRLAFDSRRALELYPDLDESDIVRRSPFLLDGLERLRALTALQLHLDTFRLEGGLNTLSNLSALQSVSLDDTTYFHHINVFGPIDVFLSATPRLTALTVRPPIGAPLPAALRAVRWLSGSDALLLRALPSGLRSLHLEVFFEDARLHSWFEPHWAAHLTRLTALQLEIRAAGPAVDRFARGSPPYVADLSVFTALRKLAVFIAAQISAALQIRVAEEVIAGQVNIGTVLQLSLDRPPRLRSIQLHVEGEGQAADPTRWFDLSGGRQRVRDIVEVVDTLDTVQ